MRLKSFYAKTMTEAMQMVREMLGEDAVIVASREEKGAVHVTAAIDPGGTAEQPTRRAPFDDTPEEIEEDWLQYDEEDEIAAVSEEITEAMLRHGVPEDVLDHVISCATVIGLENPTVALNAAVEHLFSFVPLPQKASKKPIMLVGAPGAGKTLAAAKLAARATMNGLNVGVITTDTARAGGIEQLRTFTNLLQTDLQTAAAPEDLAALLQDMSSMDQIIVDTQGTNPFDQDDVKYLARIIGAGEVEPVLVLPTGGDSEESGEMARVFSTVGVNLLMPARLDIARRIGGLLAAAYQGKMAFTDAGNTPKVADGLTAFDPAALTRILMPNTYQTGEDDDSMISSQLKKTGTRQ